MNTDAFNQWYESHFDHHLEQFFEFLRFQSISTDQAFDKETKDCGTWVSNYLKDLGFHVQMLETSFHPVLYAELIPDNPTEVVMLYHHYDVQPAEPYELWKSEPFEPEIRDGEVYARGAQDNKGQCFYALMALKAFLHFAQEQKIGIKLCIEGDEECGSRGLMEICDQYSELFAADHLLVIDAGIPSKDAPAATLGVRGIATLEAKVIACDGDLHSGDHGGIVYNPIRALSEAIGKMWDDSGKVAIPGFYDEVIPLSDEEREAFSLPFDEKAYQEQFGVRAMAVEPGYTALESKTIRPTLEINGIRGGYAGEGFKTVLPSEALAKISLRLVPDQDPLIMYEKVVAFIEKNLPQGMEVHFDYHGGGKALRSSSDSKIAQICRSAYEKAFDQEASMALMGGSIPIAGKLAEAAGAESIFLGLGLSDDNIHAPNEHFGIDRLKKGFFIVLNILTALNDHE